MTNDYRDALEAALNHIPKTATVTRDVLATLLGLIDEGVPVGGEEGLKRLVPTLIPAVMELESRIEVLEGRAEFADRFAVLLSEFS